MTDKLKIADRFDEISNRQKKDFAQGKMKNFVEGQKKTQYKKGCKPTHGWKKGNKPWNDGKSLFHKSYKLSNAEMTALQNMRIKKRNWWKNADLQTRDDIKKELIPFVKGEIPHNKGKIGWGKALHDKFPNSHPNIVLRKKGNISYAQKKLYHIIKQYYKDAVLDLKVNTVRHFRFLDIAIPSLHIDIEYDGEFWHKNKQEADSKRNEELLALGWTTIRINKSNINIFLQNLKRGVLSAI
jgi:very-short-patch-repair endonuclease